MWQVTSEIKKERYTYYRCKGFRGKCGLPYFREEEIRNLQSARFAQRLAQVHRRMDQAFQDKLDGKISEEFWTRKSAEWQAEENQIRQSIQALETARPERLLDAARIFSTRE